MTLLVDLTVEGRWPATGRAAAQPVPDLIAGLGDGGSDAAPAQLGTVAARAARLVGPDPRRGTRMPSSTAVNCGLSPARPAVTSIDNGR